MPIQPERIVAQPYTIKSDVWSTGISLLELVQNRFPFPIDLPPIELMIYITQGEVCVCTLIVGVSSLKPFTAPAS